MSTAADLVAHSATFHWPEGGPDPADADQKYLMQLSSRYNNIFSALEGRSLREVRALGFPTAQEWLDARHLSDDELKSDAERGNVNATIFYTDRRLQFIEGLIASSGAHSISEVFQASPDLLAQYEQLVIDTHVSAAGLLKIHPTPFSAYLFGVSSAVTGGADFPMPASMQLAADLGDARAPDLLRDYSSKAEGMDPNAIASAYSSMRTIAGVR